MSASDVSDRWTRLTDLPATIRQLTEQTWVKDLEDLRSHMEGLQTKIREQEATIKSQERTMLAKADEVIQLNQEHKHRQEENIELHTNLVRKRDDDRMALQQALTHQEDELREAKTSTQHLQEHAQLLQGQIQAQDVEVKRIESRLRETRSEVEQLQKTVKEQKEQMKSREQQWQAEKKAHGQVKSHAEMVGKRCADLEILLKASDDKVRHIDELASPLTEDHAVEVSKNFRKVWKQCFQFAQACFRDGMPLEQLTEPARWRSLQHSNLVNYAVPLPPTNSPAARRMRLFATLAVLTSSLSRHLFCSTYLLNPVEDLDRLLLEVADTNQDREALFRRLLNAASATVAEQLVAERVEMITDEMTRSIEPLLSVEQGQKMKADLVEVLKAAADLWRSLQKRQSCFAVEPQSPSTSSSTWKSLVWNEDKKTFAEENTKAPQDVVLTLFPRIIMLTRETEEEIFPGVVLLKPETTAAHAELSELPPLSPSLTRTGTHRSTGGRRSTVDRSSTQGSFLAQNGSAKSPPSQS